MTVWRSNSKVAAAGGGVSQHDTTHGPVGLWQLDGDLLDSSGNGYDLTVGSGTEQYAPLNSTDSAAFLDGSTYFVHDVEVAALRITGDMTFECLVQFLVDPPGEGVNATTTSPSLIAHGAAGETEATNTVYAFGPRASAPGLTWVSESGGGSNAQRNVDAEIPCGVWVHLAVVRDSNVVRTYMNGALLDTSGALTAPTGGATGRLVLGALANGSSENPTCLIASAKLIDSALTAAEIKAEVQRTLG